MNYYGPQSPYYPNVVQQPNNQGSYHPGSLNNFQDNRNSPANYTPNNNMPPPQIGFNTSCIPASDIYRMPPNVGNGWTQSNISVPGVNNGSYSVPGVNNGRYGVPGVNNGSYSVPGVNNGSYEVPGVNNGSYSVPGVNNGSYGVPGVNNGSYSVPGVNNGSYGVPGVNNGSYGVPGVNNGSYSVPGVNNRIYDVPGVNNRIYGAPGVNNGNYGVPGVNNGSYGVPGVNNGSYGVPGVNNGSYGVPGVNNRNYGVPGVNNGSYSVRGVNNASYGAPSVNNVDHGNPVNGVIGIADKYNRPTKDISENNTARSNPLVNLNLNDKTKRINGTEEIDNKQIRDPNRISEIAVEVPSRKKIDPNITTIKNQSSDYQKGLDKLAALMNDDFDLSEDVLKKNREKYDLSKSTYKP